MTLSPGIYEQVVSVKVKQEIEEAIRTGQLPPTTHPIDPIEAKHVLSQYVSTIIEKSLAGLQRTDQTEYLDKQVSIINQIISLLAKLAENDDLKQDHVADGKELLAIPSSAQTHEIVRPETSISTSTLFTGSKLEPSMMNELKREILSSDKIDMIVSFIKWSGLRLIMEELKEFTKEHRLRIITTTYMGATDPKAIIELAKLPNTEVKISYETKATRLHAKSYVFYRNTGFGTAYVGSSNISSAALGTGLEWNVKLTEQDMGHVLKIISATFDTYWNSPDFELYTENQSERLRKALKAEKYVGEHEQYNFQIEPYPFQQQILEKLKTERELHHRYKNLVVAATGTGKTVISGFDYRRLRTENPTKPNRLLFVAHRSDILKQSLACFRGILRDQNFGELWDGNNKPTSLENLFMTIQTLKSQAFETQVPADFYDMIIVDEFHHASAKSYQKLLTEFKPKILLGLTATPERMDGVDITTYFDGVTAAEIRLPEAIDRGLLSSFQYFCVTDPVDLSNVKFEYGRYDPSALEAQYLGNKLRTDTILNAIERYVTDVDQIIGLGFCVTRKHAEEMAAEFTANGMPATYLDGESSEDERKLAREQLRKKELRFIFTVNLYNEGVDIPEVNTILFLRPTESMTVFLQQLGRGLRLAEGKEVLTVHDFVAQVNKQYSFERKFRALLEKTKNSVKKEITSGFPSLPSGCFIQMEKVAMQHVLTSLANALPKRKNLITKLQAYVADVDKHPTLASFLETYDLALEDIYRFDMFSKLCSDAGIYKEKEYPKDIAKGFLRLVHIDSRRWIWTLLRIFKDGLDPVTEEDFQMVTMLYYTLNPGTPSKFGFTTPMDYVTYLRSMPHIVSELIEVLELRQEQITFLDSRVDLGYPCSLDLHCSYSRDEIEAGLGFMTWRTYNPMLEGVRYNAAKKTVIMLVTLQKSEKQYSPTTMYDDYVMSEELVHWQTQARTTLESVVGQRYINHEKEGIQMLLFVRTSKEGGATTSPYRFLGKVHYVSHEGSKPMSIVWKLEKKMPVSLFLEYTNVL